MRFIGHLDMMRYFQKAMRRASIDIAYSEGFSPHQIMSFASPLGVGLTSEGEYLDIEVHTTRSTKESLAALNAVMAEEVEVLEYRLLPDDAKNAMSLVAAADYEIFFRNPADNPFTQDSLTEALHRFYEEQESILIVKKTKKSEKEMDLKPLIAECCVIEQSKEDGALPGQPGFFFRLSAGSTDNIKPELVLQAFFAFCKEKGLASVSFEPARFSVNRREVYARENGALVPLGAFGEDIA